MYRSNTEIAGYAHKLKHSTKHAVTKAIKHAVTKAIRHAVTKATKHAVTKAIKGNDGMCRIKATLLHL